jgi:putative transposase
MARKTRIEFAGARYHILNRGNYRSWIFETPGARASFLNCLLEICASMQWRVYSWCLMGNHYHLCVETPSPNLVEGMRWLQSTFANRFNHYRKVHGHVFQGRYQSILLDGDAVGAVCHYIHLNPVRAGLIDVQSLEQYPHSSFARLWYPRRRRLYDYPEVALEYAGGLKDTPAGHRKYRDYLEWLAQTDREKQRLGFEQMSRGWAKGTQDFKKAVLEDLDDPVIQTVVEAEAREIREVRWERALNQALSLLGFDPSELALVLKGADWKVAIARYLREFYHAPHRWISEHLQMGAPSYVQSLVSRHRKLKRCHYWSKLQKHEKLD